MNPPEESGVEETGGSRAPAPEKIFLPPRAARAGVALERAMLFATWLVPVLERFPRGQRFLLGDRLQTLTLDIIEGLIEASYQKAPWDTLHRVNVLLEKQRVLCRLAYKLRHLDVRRYEFAARKLG